MKTIVSLFISIIVVPLFGQEETLLKSSYLAGESITISRKSIGDSSFLQVTHAFGKMTVLGVEKTNQTFYYIPTLVSKKIGKIDLALYEDEKIVWTGSTEIKPDLDGEIVMESYCGPKHLIVSKSDFSMITATVLDQYDNPLPANTEVQIDYLANNSLKKQTISTSHLLGFKRVYAPKKSGFGSVSTSYENVGSKEFRLDFYANDPENYQIEFDRQHAFADGNQLISITTSIIQDRFGNTVENGTLVYFTIIDTEERLTSGSSETINGIAQFEVPAPENTTIWRVNSYIKNYAKSSELTIPFKPSVTDFDVTASEKNIIAGPIKGFMNQFVKDGTMISFMLLSEEKMLSYELPTKEGIAKLNFEKKIIPIGRYDVTVAFGDIKKELKIEVK